MAVGATPEALTGQAAGLADRPPLPAAPELTFVFTDIERSTALLERLGGAYGDVLATHAELVRTLLEQRGGHEVDTQGDAFFLVFTDAVHAILFTADLQRRLAGEAWPRGANVRLRIGVHTGRAELRRTGYVGLDVHKGARVAAAGHGGQVLVTAETAARLPGDLPAHLALGSLGTFHLKDIREPVELLALAGPGLASDFPPPRTLDELDEPPAPGEPPYLGLAAFGEADAERFFGREALVERLLARLDDVPFLAVVGASGSGKSSLVRAGLVPALRRRFAERDAAVPVEILTPGEDPLAALEAAIADQPGTSGAVVVDQLEELFTLTRDEALRVTFVDRLLALLDAGTRVIVTLRADFYDRLAAFDRLRTLAAEHQEYLGPLTHEDLRRAIEGPAELGGWRFDPGLVDLILHDVGDEPGALPLLSHAIRETWGRRRGTLMTLRGYLDSGGVQGAIARTADETVGGLQGTDLSMARDILLRLTELGEEAPDTRRRAPLTELVAGQRDPAAAQAVLDRLVAARLVVLEGAEAEVAHEALIREWPTLRGWLEDDREGLRLHRALTLAARDWDASGRDPSLLLRGARLAGAREWLAGAASATILERALIQASDEAERADALEREAQRERELEAARALAASEASAAARLRRRAYALGGIVVLALLLAGFSYLQLQRADEATIEARSAAQLAVEREAEAEEARLAAEERQREAEEQRALAHSRQLAAQSQANGDQLDLSLLLALEAVDVADTVEARGSLLDALNAEPMLVRFLSHDAPVHDLAFDPDGRTLRGAATEEGAVVSWDIVDGTRTEVGRVPEIIAETTSWTTFVVSPDGRLVAHELPQTGEAPPGVGIWDVATGERVATLPLATWTRAIEFSPDGRTLATVEEDLVVLWDHVSLERLAELRTPRTTEETWPHEVVFSPDGTQLAWSSWDGIVAIADVAELTVREVRAADPTYDEAVAMGAMAFSPDGLLLALGGSDGSITVWDTEQGREIGHADSAHEGAVGFLSFGDGGSVLASSGMDGEIVLSQVDGMTRIGEPITVHGDYLQGLAFSPDGRTLASADFDGLVALWDIERRHRLAEVAVDAAEHVTPAGLLMTAAMDPAGDRLALGLESGSILLWDLERGAPLHEPFVAHVSDAEFVPSPGIHALAFDPDGRTLASSGPDGAVRLWDVASGAAIGEPGHGHDVEVLAGSIPALAFSPDGSVLVSGGDDATIRFWDPRTGAAVGEPLRADTPEADGYIEGAETFIEYVRDIAFHPDGLTFATAGARSSVLWDARTMEQLGEPLGGHTTAVMSVAFSPDGRLLAASDMDGAVLIWDVERREVVQRLRHRGIVFRVRFDPSGALIAASTQDGIVLWDVATGQRYGGAITGPGSTAIAFTPDRPGLMSVDHLGASVLRWGLDPASWMAQASELAGRELTPEERATYLVDGSTAPGAEASGSGD